MSRLVLAKIHRGPWRAGIALRALVLATALAGVVPGAVRAQEAVPGRGSLSVDEAVRLALAHNKDVLSSGENVDAASGLKKQAMQGYLPRLVASGTYTHSFNNNGFFDQSSGKFVQDNYSVRYTLSQSILDISSLKNISASNKELEASRLTYSFSRADLVLAVKQQYYVLLAAQELASVSDSALALSEHELARTQSLFELGMVARSDVLKAQVRVSSSKLDVIRDRGNVVNERARLARIVGQDPTDDLRASDTLTETAVTVDSTKIFENAVAQRADLRAALKNWEAARARAGAARAEFLPLLAGQVNYSNGNTSGLQPFAGFSDNDLRGSRSASVGLSIPLLDGLLGRKGQIQTAQARAEQERYAYEKKKLDVAVEVREAINAARQANEGVDVARTGLVSAEEDLKLSQEKYNVGSGTILELLDAQVNLQKARQQSVLALTQARIAEAQIERARGTLP